MPYQHLQCYEEIKEPNSLEEAVDTFWGMLLHRYFKIELCFIISQETRPNRSSRKKADWSIRSVKDGRNEKVILMEDKRRSCESSSAAWREALNQLIEYMRLVCEKQVCTEVLYCSVNIGTHTRFYQFDPKTEECSDYQGTGGKLYELAEDEGEIHGSLHDWVNKTSS